MIWIYLFFSVHFVLYLNAWMLSKPFEMVECICSKSVVPTYPVSVYMENELK